MFRYPGHHGAARERGQASLAYIGALLAVAVIVSTATVAAAGNQEKVTKAAQCAADKVIYLGQKPCDPGTPGDPGDPADPEDPADPTGPGGERPKSCDDVIYANSTRSGTTHSNPSEYSRQVRVNCIWYPVNPECVELAGIPNWEPGLTVPPDQGEALQKLVDCVTGGVGPPKPDPDDVTCNKTTIMTGKVTKDPPLAQFGCTEFVVPIECKSQWDAWNALPEDASPGDRQQASIGLQSCMENFYEKNETVCIVKQDSETNKTEITLLFFLKIEESNGVIIEQLGDGRWRVHMLDETKVGGDFKLPDFGKGAEFGLMASTGWSSDKTFEFGDKASAEAWVEWYKDYAKTTGAIKRRMDGPCPKGECWANPWDTKHLKELMDTEPKRKKHSEATGRSTEVSVSGGFNPPGGGVGASANYKAEGGQENRYFEDGGKAVTLTMSDAGGASLLAKLSKSSKKDGAEDKPGDTSGGLKGALGADFKGKVSLTAYYNPNGSLGKVIMSVDDTAMATLVKLDPSISVKLPGGFSVDASFTYQHDEGTATIRENVIDVGTHEYLRDQLEATMSEIFPQDDEGKFSDDAPSLNFETGGIGDLTDTVGTTRDLKYDVTVDEVSGGGGVSFAGLPLVEIKGGKVTEGRDLTGSSLDVIDVNGNKTTMTPSPKCKAKQINPDDYVYDKGPPYADREDYEYD
jgi:hypothetical protein